MVSIVKSAETLFKSVSDALSGVRTDLENTRLQIIEKSLERHALEHAPISQDEIAARIDGILDSCEASALDRGWSWSWLSSAGNERSVSDLAYRLEELFKLHPIGFLSLLGSREQLRAAMTEEALTAMPVETKQYTPNERASALAKLDAEIEALEILEERIIRSAEKNGINLERREDANPAIFLRYDSDLK